GGNRNDSRLPVESLSMRHGLVVVLAVFLAPAALTRQTPAYDLVLKHARVLDGTGSPWFRADIAIAGDTIAAIAASIDAPAGRVIDVHDHVVAPGFIDIHTHARRGIDQTPTAANYV